jgi:hypothetical protein
MATSTTSRPPSTKQRSTLHNRPTAPWLESNKPTLYQDHNGSDLAKVTASHLRRPAAVRASGFVPAATLGNSTAIEIAAAPDVVWRAIEELCFDELRDHPAADGRSIAARPGSQSRGVALAAAGGGHTADRGDDRCPVHCALSRAGHDSHAGNRWTVLDAGGADDNAVDSAVAFDQPGFVKSAIDFELKRTERGPDSPPGHESGHRRRPRLDGSVATGC